MIDYIKDNWVLILVTVYGVVSVIALLTPSDKDNTFIEKVGSVADAFGLKLKGKGSITDLVVSVIKNVITLIKRGKGNA